MLELDGLEVRYGAVAAVRGLSLRLDKGEIVGLIGSNGAGKSTTLHAIMGLVRAHAGEIRLAGRSIRGRPPEAVARLGVALVPEGRRIYANLTVAENLRLGFAARRSRHGARRTEDVAWLHDLFPVVKEFADRPAGTLSGGQQQQLAIARAFVARPDVLLLDEPSLGLAPQLVDVVFQVLAQIRERGVTVLLVEQRAQRTVAFADRTYVLSNGELVTTFGPADADDTERLIAAYFGS
jgi:branched-chain amino acid transport system ATP-binding protein